MSYAIEDIYEIVKTLKIFDLDDSTPVIGHAHAGHQIV